MSPDDQVSALESAIIERAQNLADEHIKQASRARERIMEDSAERLRLLEEKEILVAKAKAEREYRRKVQASEIRMQAELDRLRWNLVRTVLDNTRLRLTQMRADQSSYLPMFKRLLAEAAASIEREELVALVSDTDHRHLAEGWDAISREAVPDKRVKLSDEVCPCSGGVLVRSQDNRISVDNTFEGRLARMEFELHRVILERLFPTGT